MNLTLANITHKFKKKMVKREQLVRVTMCDGELHQAFDTCRPVKHEKWN